MRRMFFNKFTMLVLIVILFSVMLPKDILVYGQNVENKHVLILNSYRKGRDWSDDIMDGIQKKLWDKDKNIDISIEYMDSTIYSPDELMTQLYNLYSFKYKSEKFDAVIASDNFAFDFLKKYSNKLFPNTPIVFCGVNNYSDDMIKDEPLFTGAAEIIDFQGTLDIALKLQPNTKEAAIVLDNTITGKEEKKLIEDAVKKYNNKVKFIYIIGLSFLQTEKEIKKLPGNSIIFLAANLEDSSGDLISTGQSAIRLSSDFKIPIYSCWDYYLNYGVIGGMMTVGRRQGELAGDITNQILGGKRPYEIPVIKEKPTQYLFDYNQMKRFGILRMKLPKGSKVINSDLVTYNIPQRLLWGIFVLMLILLLLVIIILLTGIIKRKKAEIALKKSEELLRTLINATPDIICFKDPDGRWLEANISMLKLFKLEKADYRFKTNFQLGEVVNENKNQLLDLEKDDRLIWQHGTIFREERTFRQPDGELKVYDIIKVPTFRPDNSKNGLVVLGRDITEKLTAMELKKNVEKNEKRVIELVEYEKLRTEFFANISHELRTPLNVILGALQLQQLLQKNGDMIYNTQKMERYSNVMKQNCYRLVRLVNNLIDITKIDAGYFQVELSNNDIVSVVENITLSVKEFVESKGIELLFDTDTEEKEMAFDPDKIERIILNLLSNSIKFTDKGGNISVTVNDKKDMVAIHVKDTGIGIPEEKQKVVFDRFVQVDKSLSRNVEGSGIGLSLVKSLVELHNGTISLISEYGKGSEFIIELPVILLSEDKQSHVKSEKIQQSNIEKINIEFSDIYA